MQLGDASMDLRFRTCREATAIEGVYGKSGSDIIIEGRRHPKMPAL